MIIKQFSVYHFFRGHIGRKYVIKHYGKKVVKTKFPDMSNIKPSLLQKICRQRFADATVYATAIMHDEMQRKEWEQRTGKRKNKLRGELISRHMKAAKQKELQAQIASGKCISYEQVQLLPYQGQAIQQGFRSSSQTTNTKRSRKLKPLSHPAMEGTGKQLSRTVSSSGVENPSVTKRTKRKPWIKTNKNDISIRIPVIKIPSVARFKESIYQLLLGIISLIPLYGDNT